MLSNLLNYLNLTTLSNNNFNHYLRDYIFLIVPEKPRIAMMMPVTTNTQVNVLLESPR